MTITPLVLARLCQAIYKPSDEFDTVIRNDSVTVGIKKIGDVSVFAFAGSEDFTDWRNDFTAVGYDHPQLKTIHLGFWQGVADIFDKLKPYLTGLIAMAGHSLGCAHAAYVSALAGLSGVTVGQLLLFAPPRMSYQPLADMLNSSVPDFRAWVNGSDPVPNVPFYLPFAPWVPVTRLIAVNSPPENSLNIFAWHSVDLYVKYFSIAL